MKLLKDIFHYVFGYRYYVNIVNTIGTDIVETTSFIHPTRQAAREHARQIAATRSFIYIETVSFWSRNFYNG